MKPLIIDTDTLSYFFRNHPGVVSKLDSYLQTYGFVNISVVTYYEVLNGLYYRDAKSQIPKFEQFVSFNKVLPLTTEIARKAAEIHAGLRKKGLPIGHNDTLIAAFAMVHDLILVTNNHQHFSRIEDLLIDNWV